MWGCWEGFSQEQPEHLGQHRAAVAGEAGNRPAGGAADSQDRGRQGTGPRHTCCHSGWGDKGRLISIPFLLASSGKLGSGGEGGVGVGGPARGPPLLLLALPALLL